MIQIIVTIIATTNTTHPITITIIAHVGNFNTLTSTYPPLDTTKVGKELVDCLIKELNGQELFHNFQNRVNGDLLA